MALVNPSGIGPADVVVVSIWAALSFGVFAAIIRDAYHAHATSVGGD
ncbi:hypothetical protein [Nocardia brasiliensis]